MPDAVRLIASPSPRMLLGEGPTWDERDQVIYWVDIERKHVHQCRADGTDFRTHVVSGRIGCLALRERAPGFVAAIEHHIGYLTFDPPSFRAFATVDSEEPNNRCNDGKCDVSGRFWVGTLREGGARASGWLYCVGRDLQPVQSAGPFICVNGPAFSPDGRILYCVDTYGRTIYRYEIDHRGGLQTGEPLVRYFDPDWGYPDGLTTDREGCLWVAHWGGGCVTRFSPEGRALEQVSLPVSQVTNCVFGGDDLCTLFITTASKGLERPGSEPQSGGLFAVDLSVGGYPAHRFRG